MSKKTLFGASFDQSKKIVTEDILTEDGAGIGVLSSMSFWRKCLAFVVLALVFIGYFIGIAFPEGMLNAPNEDIKIISQSTAHLMGVIGIPMRPIIELFMYSFVALVFINFIPKLNYAHQLVYGWLTMIFFAIFGLFSVLPLATALTLGAFGSLAFILQVLIIIYFGTLKIRSTISNIKGQLYHHKQPAKDWMTLLQTLIKKYGGFLLLLSILNRWFFHFGDINKGGFELFSLIYGWIFLFFSIGYILMLQFIIKHIVTVFYFFKYRNEYRTYFKIPNEIWYGKLRGKLKNKLKNKRRTK
ncbi:hypothetical protein [Streptococcus sp. CSL10205-OR2]|uniref:hypothetical protein n=1 Tax=Streptococcus sp. CSL10205-OR2 TaxID=2980558 RepID=UPI0021D81828|nr:hypothetical protein [Streptococcus sp. CSL10205-OR2]MCU9533218.1 hypothetical protein [Streptococcus sp. CSL10205-OR2]